MTKKIKSTAHIYPDTIENIGFLARILKQGGLVAVPTETVYGLAADALNSKACHEIFVAKGRPTNDPLIVHVYSINDVEKIAETNPLVAKLAKAFWPGPLTLILPKKLCVPDIVTSHHPSVAVRIPSHPTFRKLLKKSGLALAAPSANPFGYVSPTTSEHVLNNLGAKIRYILEGGASKVGVESTILDIRDVSKPKLLRPGGITKKAIERVLKKKVVHSLKRTTTTKNQVAPGLLTHHYSPHTPLIVKHRLTLSTARNGLPDVAWLFIKKPKGRLTKNCFYLSKTGNLKDVARHLFSKLRSLDTGAWSKIYVEKAPGNGLAVAINDRLKRAETKRSS
jgi:L-threonylcarbamoyladenylate synthase